MGGAIPVELPRPKRIFLIFMATKGFTQLEHKFFIGILGQYRFTFRQVRILLLIIRLTVGCQKSWVKMKLVDFEVVGIYKGDIREDLNLLIERKILFCNQEHLMINDKIDEWEIKKNKLFTEAKFGNLLTQALAKHSDDGKQNANEQVSKTLTHNQYKPQVHENFSYAKETDTKLKKEILESQKTDLIKSKSFG